MSEILTRLRGYNPPDRTTHDRLISQDIHDAADEIERLRAALARETERAENAERLAERLKQEAIFHAGEARAQRATVHEAAQIASGASGEKADWNGAVPVRELLDRAVRAESERDRLRESLKSEQACAKEYHDEWQKAELAARNAVGHADSLRQGAINWRERAWTAERKLAALSHLGTGAGRRAG